MVNLRVPCGELLATALTRCWRSAALEGAVCVGVRVRAAAYWWMLACAAVWLNGQVTCWRLHSTVLMWVEKRLHSCWYFLLIWASLPMWLACTGGAARALLPWWSWWWCFGSRHRRCFGNRSRRNVIHSISSAKLFIYGVSS